MSAGLTYAAFGLVFAALLSLEVVRGSRRSLTFGGLVCWLVARVPTLAALFLVWAWLGWHLFARGSVSFLK